MRNNFLKKKHKNLKFREERYYYNIENNNSFDNEIIKNCPFLYKPGKIKYAKKHASADRPLHKIRNFTKETDFCNCCNLPCETKNIIEPFKMDDSIDKFSECGLGITLYFYFLRYAIICLILVFVLLDLPMIIFNKYYSNELISICNLNYKNNMSLCIKYIDDKTKSHNYTNIISIPFSVDNVYIYREFAIVTTGSDENVIKTIISYGILDSYCILTLIILNLYFLILINQIIYFEKANNCSPSIYTLYISNINNSLDYYEDYCLSKKIIINDEKEKFNDFVKFLKNKIIYNKKKSENIYDINFCYKLKEFKKLVKEEQKINYKLLQIVNNSKQKKVNIKNDLYGEKRRYFEIICCCACKKGPSIKSLLKKRELNKTKLNYFLENSKILTKSNFAGSIFLTFNTIQQKEEYYNMYPHYFIEKIIVFLKESKFYLCCCCINEKSKRNFFRRKNIKVLSAPEPEDVIWENIEYDFWFRFKRGLIIYFISFLLLLISFIFVLGLTYYKSYLANNNITSSFIIKYGVSLLITIAINIINEIFYLILEKLTKKERHISMTNYYLSFSVKLTFFTFSTSGIVPLVSNFIENGLKNNEYLVDNMIIIFLCNSFLSPTLWTFNIKYIYKRIRIYFIERKKDPDKNHNMNQKELNHLYQLPDMNISYKYSYIAKTLFLSFFYISIFPLGIFISLTGFVYAYYIEFFNFTHLYKRPQMINERICLFYSEYFFIYLFIFSLGELIFMESIFSSNIWTVFDIIIFAIFSIVPFTKLLNLKYIKLNNDNINNTNIEDVYFSFYNDYERQNPITKIDGLKNYINKLRVNGYISEKVYNFAYMNIDNINIMELYYRSEMNRNIEQSKQALTNYKKSYTYNQDKNMQRLEIKEGKLNSSFEKSKRRLSNGSSVYDEQLKNLLRQSIYEQKFESNLDDSNKNTNFKNKYNSNDSKKIKILPNKKRKNNKEELKNEILIENNKDYILRQYNHPFLLNISQDFGIDDSGMISIKQKQSSHIRNLSNGKNYNEELNDTLNGINLNEDENDKNNYGIDYDLYSQKLSSSSLYKIKSRSKLINIEMKDLSNKNKENENKIKYKYEIDEYNKKNQGFVRNPYKLYEIRKRKDNIYQNNKNNINNISNRKISLKEYLLSFEKNRIDEVDGSDYDY